MRLSRRQFIGLGVGIWGTLLFSSGGSSVLRAEQSHQPLPSWNDNISKSAIINFVSRVTKPDHPDFVPEAERIAVFDNDGTLWSEQPAYFQLIFSFDRIKALVPQKPEWQTQQPFKAVLENNLPGLSASGNQGILNVIAASHAGMTTSEFETLVQEWLASARHPRFDRPYTDLVFQPMLEVLTYLRQNGFKTYIVSGGGVDFLRAWAPTVYGIPPEQIIGSRLKTQFEIRQGEPVLIRQPEVEFINDKAGKPIAIQQIIGRRPIMAFGNSDGDLQMLQWTTAGQGPRLGVLVHHTDAQREWAYDRQSLFGRLDKALDEAQPRGWVVVDMKQDWRTIYPFQLSSQPKQVKSGSWRKPQ
jgi:phosphoserine phosphatase